ncbi:hypothetical protein ACRALDRAFT_1080233 [Sodiomyces alcalophilus JCM 7366]|uniref:uncharacterized protein n=1 Tax=Sodiomyces alcalophilus JCM 7366 TaxID=591952 RepID=UPI0039B4DCE7
MSRNRRLLRILVSSLAVLTTTTTALPTTPTPTAAPTHPAIVHSPEPSSVPPPQPGPAIAAAIVPAAEVEARTVIEEAVSLVPAITPPPPPPPTNANGPPDYDTLIPADPAAAPRPTADLSEHGLTQVTYYSCATYPTTTHCGWHRPLISVAAAPPGRGLHSDPVAGTTKVLVVAGIVVAWGFLPSLPLSCRL